MLKERFLQEETLDAAEQGIIVRLLNESMVTPCLGPQRNNL
jgi:hypothetical protein